MYRNMEKIVIATKNKGKLAEIKAILQGLGVTVQTMDQYEEIGEIVEDGKTFLENARKKAHMVSKLTGLYALADDTGLCVDALAGGPGVYSARYAGDEGNYAANNQRLLEELAKVPDEKRGAHFECVMVLAAPDGRDFVTVGRLDGFILRELRGDGGFGYDPLFFVPEDGKTIAELGMGRKNEISHRGKALRQMRQIIVDLLNKSL